MASTAIIINDMFEAINNGTVPGEFNADRTEFTFPQLVYEGTKAIHEWAIIVRLIKGDTYVPMEEDMLKPGATLSDHRGEILVRSSQKGGKEREVVPTYVTSGKNLGRKNATNVLTQALRDALSLYNKQKKKVKLVVMSPVMTSSPMSSPMSSLTPSNIMEDALFMPPPMLARKMGDNIAEIKFQDGVTLQRKYNGVHIIIFRKDPSSIILYSRTGIQYPGLNHIRKEILNMIERYELTGKHFDAYFAGELYTHGKSLQYISGQARKEKDEGNLGFHIFDAFFPKDINIPSRERQQFLREFFAASSSPAHPHIHLIEGFPVKNMEEVNELTKRFIDEGYEGAIARNDSAGYQYSYGNYHSPNLVKIKPVLDDEFIVVGFSQGTKGKDVGAIIWECETKDGKRFSVVPKDMKYEDRYKLFKIMSEGDTFEKIKGLPMTVEYREISSFGIPLQAKALQFRTYENGPDKDPIRELLG